MNPYEMLDKILVNNERIKECDEALKDMEDLIHILFRLQNNRMIRELSKSAHMSSESDMITDICGAVQWKKAEIQAEIGGYAWQIKQDYGQKPRGRPRKEAKI